MTVAAGPGRPDCAGRPGRQSGQAIVLVALAMVAMLAMTAVVLSAGQLYWARRSAQQLADSGALAAAAMIPCSGQNAYAALDGVISTQLGVSPSLSQTPAACGTSPSTWSRTYPNGTGVAATYPYVDTTRVQVVVTLPAWLVLGGLLGVGQASVSARAVAQNSGASPPRNYALYAQDGIKCGGTAVFDLKGSIYSGGPIDGNCTIYSHAIPNDDPGNILVYPANQQWNQGGGACVSGTATGNVVCADGYEISQSQCPPAGSTDFFGSLRVDYPCPTWTVQAPSYAPYSSPDPNADARAQATIGGAACDPGGGAATYLPLLIGTTAVGRMKPGLAVVGGLTVPNTPYKDGGGYYHFRPGCRRLRPRVLPLQRIPPELGQEGQPGRAERRRPVPERRHARRRQGRPVRVHVGAQPLQLLHLVLRRPADLEHRLRVRRRPGQPGHHQRHLVRRAVIAMRPERQPVLPAPEREQLVPQDRPGLQRDAGLGAARAAGDDAGRHRRHVLRAGTRRAVVAVRHDLLAGLGRPRPGGLPVDLERRVLHRRLADLPECAAPGRQQLDRLRHHVRAHGHQQRPQPGGADRVTAAVEERQ